MKYLAELLGLLEPRLEKLKKETTSPRELYEPLSYILALGGKRIRPALVLSTYKLYREDISDAVLDLALAVEMFHNFSLIHDDIMDEASLRRSAATVHVKWDVPTAILSGDLMLIRVYQKLTELQNPVILQAFNRMAIALCEGQMKDMLFEKRETVSNEEYLDMISQKTGVLLGFCMEAGALIAGAEPKAAAQLYHIGLNLGLAFQVRDDYLDCFGTQDTVGKKIGGDILERKKTFPWNEMMTNLNPEEKRKIQSCYAGGNEDEIVREVKQLMIKSGAAEKSLSTAEEYEAKAREAFEKLNYPGKNLYILEIFELLSGRNF